MTQYVTASALTFILVLSIVEKTYRCYWLVKQSKALNERALIYGQIVSLAPLTMSPSDSSSSSFASSALVSSAGLASVVAGPTAAANASGLARYSLTCGNRENQHDKRKAVIRKEGRSSRKRLRLVSDGHSEFSVCRFLIT